MKKVLFSILLAFPFCLSAQENWIYTEVVEVRDVPAKDLYLRGKAWFASSFTDSRNILVTDNLETGMIANASIQVNFKSTMMMRTSHVKFRMGVYFKDGRYKYELKDFVHEDTNGTNYPGAGGSLSNEKPDCGGIGMILKDWKTIKDITNTEIGSLIESLKIRMNNPTESQKNNW